MSMGRQIAPEFWLLRHGQVVFAGVTERNRADWFMILALSDGDEAFGEVSCRPRNTRKGSAFNDPATE